MAIKIGERIRELRLKNGLSQQQIADLLGITRQGVSRIENGLNDSLKTSQIATLAEALHTTPSHLMGWESEKSKFTIAHELHHLFPKANNKANNDVNFIELANEYLGMLKKKTLTNIEKNELEMVISINESILNTISKKRS